MREVLPGTRRYTQHTIYELAESIRERDVITYTHCRRVAIYANRLARALGLSRRAARDVALAGLVHDLGKTWIQNDILMKDAPLSVDEREKMKRHPGIAARILQAYDVPDALVDAVLHHHEAYDGRGYPDGLAGDAIPNEARILTIADVFDVITSARPYKEPVSAATARERMLADSGTFFDPGYTAAFVALLDAREDFLLPHMPVVPEFDHAAEWVRHDAYERDPSR